MVRTLQRLHKFVYWIAIIVMVWVFLLYGLPRMRAALPGVCARWNLSGGFCSEQVQGWLARLDGWAHARLQPFEENAYLRWAARDATRAVGTLEQSLREKFGDERVDAASRGADVALGRLERLTESGRADTREKLSAASENTRMLLSNARASFERLRNLLRSTSRRAEDVSKAVGETQKALDALSNVLPEKKK